jgi:hypothetical protein
VPFLLRVTSGSRVLFALVDRRAWGTPDDYEAGHLLPAHFAVGLARLVCHDVLTLWPEEPKACARGVCHPGDPPRLRTPYWLGDSAVRLHALASLITQAQPLLPQAVHDARDQELTWAEIGELLNISAATAARRYRNQP